MFFEKYKKKILTFFFLSFLFSNGYAATGTSVGNIYLMLWYEGHTGVLVKQEGMADLGGCGRGDYYILDDKHAYFSEVYALLLASHFSSQSLKISLDGCVQGISRIKHVASDMRN